MANELETRIATLERQVIELTKLINTSQTLEKASSKLAAASTPASTKSKRVTLSEGTTIDVSFHQQWVDKNRLPNPLAPGSFISVDDTFENAEIMAYWATTKSPAYATLKVVKIKEPENQL